MAQFDCLIIFPVIFSLFVTIIFYYYMSIKIKIPNFFEVKKFRKKTLKSSSFYLFFKSNLKLNSKNSYKQAVVFNKRGCNLMVEYTLCTRKVPVQFWLFPKNFFSLSWI